MDLIYGKLLQKSVNNQVGNNRFPSLGIEIAVGHWTMSKKIFDMYGQNQLSPAIKESK